MRRIILFIQLLALGFGLEGCRKREKSIEWNVDAVFPLAYGELSMYDLLPDTLITSNIDSTLQLRFETDLFALSLDSLAGMVDTTFEYRYMLPFSVPFTLQPGQQIANNPETNRLDLDGAELREIVVFKGSSAYRIESSIQGEVIYTYQILSARDALGNIFSQQVVIPKAENGQKGVYEGSFSLDGYRFDLTGPNQNTTNTVLTNMIIQLSENNSGAVTVSNQDTLFIANTFTDIQIEKATGYFGQHTYYLGPEATAINFFRRLVSGGFQLNQLTAQLTLENGIGIDAMLKVNNLYAQKLNASPISLMHEIIGHQQVLNRAYRIGDEVYPQSLFYMLDENTSNISEMIELMPDSIGYAAQVVVNPLGNVSAYNDFAYRQYPLRLRLDVDMPLNAIANQLTLVDTLLLELEDENPLNDLTLFIQVENGFPLSAAVRLSVLDGNEMVAGHLLSSAEVPSGSLGPDNRVVSSSQSYHVLAVQPKDMENIQRFKKIRLEVVFDSPGNDHLFLYEHYKLKYTIRAKSSLKINIRP
jgi:hypothetical protein